MAFSLDFDIYNWLLVEILKVNPTGDPVNDAVYLVLLPMVVLYMFVTDVTARSRFNSNTIKLPVMFVMGFFIVREGFYPIFAGFSLPLLIFLMVWYSIDFIRGDFKNKDEPGKEYSYQTSSGGEGIIGGALGTLFHPFGSAMDNLNKSVEDVSLASWSEQEIREEAGRLIAQWESEEQRVRSNTQGNSGWTPAGNQALLQQGIIENELAKLVRGVKSNHKKVDVFSIIADERLKRNINLKLSAS